MGTGLVLARVWLVFLAAFEIPEIVGFLSGASLSGGFGSNLCDSEAEKRLWSGVFPRLSGVFTPRRGL